MAHRKTRPPGDSYPNRHLKVYERQSKKQHHSNPMVWLGSHQVSQLNVQIVNQTERFSFIGEGVHRRGLTRCLQQNTVRPSHNRICMRIQLTPVSCFLLRRCTDCKFLGFSDSDRVCGPSVVVVRGGLGRRKQSFGFWFLAHCCSCHLGKDLLYGMCMATKLITWTLNPWSSHRIVVSTSRIHCRVCTAGKSR